MSTQSTRAQLQTLKDSLIRSNAVGGLTRGSDVRTMMDALIASLSNILDDKDQVDGYAGLDDNGKLSADLLNNFFSSSANELLDSQYNIFEYTGTSPKAWDMNSLTHDKIYYFINTGSDSVTINSPQIITLPNQASVSSIVLPPGNVFACIPDIINFYLINLTGSGGTTYTGTSGEIIVTGTVISIDSAYAPGLNSNEVGRGDSVTGKLSGGSDLTMETSGLNLGNATRTNQRILRVGQGSNFIDLGEYTGGGFGVIYFDQISPNNTNYGFIGNTSNTQMNATSQVTININDNSKIIATSTLVEFTIAAQFDNLITFKNQYSTTSAPSVSLGPGSGTGATSSFSTGSNNQSGIITLNTGTLPGANASIFSLTPSGGFSAPNNCIMILFPANANAGAGGFVAFYDPASSNTTTAIIKSASIGALTASTTYIWAYQLIYI